MKKPLPDLPPPVDYDSADIFIPFVDNTPPVISPPAPTTYFKKFAFALAVLLTLMGACSDGAQKLFGSGQAFGIDDITHDIQASTDNPLVRFGISYLLLGALAAAIQSIGLEKTFTLNFIFDLFNLSVEPEASPTLLELQAQSLFTSTLQLAWYERLTLGLIRSSGAAVRGISSLIGYRTISNSLPLYIIVPPALVDAGQTLATEGIYLNNLYLLARLRLKANYYPNRYPAEFLTLCRTHIDADAYQCQSTRGRLIYLSCIALGTLAVLSDIGLAKLVLDRFAFYYGIDTDALFFTIPSYIGLSSLFILISAIDSKSLADSVSRYVEQQTPPVSTASNPGLTTHPLILGIAGLISLIGASITALGAYEGNNYLFEQLDVDTSQSLIGLSVLVAVLKGCQSLAVEGCYTLKAAWDSQWQPSCQAVNRFMSAVSTVFCQARRGAPLAAISNQSYATLA